MQIALQETRQKPQMLSGFTNDYIQCLYVQDRVLQDCHNCQQTTAPLKGHNYPVLVPFGFKLASSPVRAQPPEA